MHVNARTFRNTIRDCVAMLDWDVFQVCKICCIMSIIHLVIHTVEVMLNPVISEISGRINYPKLWGTNNLPIPLLYLKQFKNNCEQCPIHLIPIYQLFMYSNTYYIFCVIQY